MHGTRETNRGEEVQYHTRQRVFVFFGEREARVIRPFVCAGHVQRQLQPRAQKHVSGVSTLLTSTVHVHCEGLVGREFLMLLGISVCDWRMLRCSAPCSCPMFLCSHPSTRCALTAETAWPQDR